MRTYAPIFVYGFCMTDPPTTSESFLEHSSDGPAASPATLPDRLLAAAVSPPLTGVREDVSTTPCDASHVDQSGRLLGPRALRTRERILKATISLLDEKSMRDLHVIDIARRIGSSPATFYQYFKDVTDVILELATEVSEMTPEMIELIHGDWSGSAGHERGVRLVNLVTDHWDHYKSILRVRNNAADEGDPAFREVRLKSMLPMVMAFSEVIRAAKGQSGSEDPESGVGRIRPISGAMILFTSLESMATHHEIFERRFEPMGEGREALVETIATILQATLIAKR